VSELIQDSSRIRTRTVSRMLYQQCHGAPKTWTTWSEIRLRPLIAKHVQRSQC